MEIFKVSTLEETQGRPTKEKHDGATATDMQKDGLLFKKYTTQLLLLGKFEYTGGPIFKVVLEC